MSETQAVVTEPLPAKFNASNIVETGVVDGIRWMTYPAPLYGAINGYVLLPDGHPWANLGYDDMPVDVHGGLTFGPRNGWIGFDTLHAGDRWPGEPGIFPPDPEWDVNWTAQKVAAEARSLAKQVAEAAS